MLRRSAASAATLAAGVAFPGLASIAADAQGAGDSAPEQRLYAETLKTWCDGLLARQVTEMRDRAFYGGLLCPSCVFIHGRCGDAVYPLLRMAHTTGEAKYLRAAMLVHEWSQVQVSRSDGSWINDVTLSNWQGITVFHTIALAEALEHHGEVLDASTRARWKDRLTAAAKFLDGFITIETGNVNYPVTATLAFQLCGRVLGESHYFDRAHALAHDVLGQFSPDGFLFGEGHPLTGVSPKGCRPVDIGYNVEESLPSLALYSLLADDKPVQQQVVAAMKTHMEFMLPDGAWDNSFGSRNYKWSWWGSRTSDGCHPGFVLMSKFDPRFREVARRNLELMAASTHDGLLYGGPDFFAHGDLPCIHHTFTHAKAMATVLDRGTFETDTAERPKLPRDEAYTVKSFSTVGTKLAAVGAWRATVTEYDWEYSEHVQPGAGNLGGGHVSGGALSMLYHMRLGPILTASMTEYLMVEIANQQQFREGPHMALTPRLEYASGETYTSLNDFKAALTANQSNGEVVFDAQGRMLTASRKPVPAGEILYHMVYRLSESGVEIVGGASDELSRSAPLRLIVPVIAREGERVEQVDARTVRVIKAKGALTVTTDASSGFEASFKEKTFNLVPGFEAFPFTVAPAAGKHASIRLQAG
ncbi:MAG: hypothetical protein WAL45_21290 [Terracidiphilus sp.]